MIGKRNKAIDILKGIGILLVLTAHSLEGFVSQFAYTFHMPLFFIVTGLFIAEVPLHDRNIHSFIGWWKEMLKKDFRRLLYPALFTTFLILLVSCLSFVWQDVYFQNPIKLVWNSTPHMKYEYIIMLGNLWFLFALFFAKQSFYLVRQLFNDRWLPWMCLLLGAMAVWSAQYAILPIGIQVGISVLPFIWIGFYLKHHGGVDEGVPHWFYLSILVWGGYIFFGRLQVNRMLYTWHYVPDIIAACGGTLFFYHVSKVIANNTKYIKRCLSFLGMYSLLLICAPTIETYCFPMQQIIPQIPFRPIFVVVGKVAWCALFVFVCIRVSFLSAIFGIKKKA